MEHKFRFDQPRFGQSVLIDRRRVRAFRGDGDGPATGEPPACACNCGNDNGNNGPRAGKTCPWLLGLAMVNSAGAGSSVGDTNDVDQVPLNHPGRLFPAG